MSIMLIDVQGEQKNAENSRTRQYSPAGGGDFLKCPSCNFSLYMELEQNGGASSASSLKKSRSF